MTKTTQKISLRQIFIAELAFVNWLAKPNIRICTLLVFNLIGLSLMLGPAISQKIGPIEKIEALKAQEGQNYTFIVRFKENASAKIDPSWLTEKHELIAEIPLTNSLAVDLKVADAFSIADQDHVKQVWYLHPDEAPITIRTIQGLDYSVRTLGMPNLANLSLGPPSGKFYVKKANNLTPMQHAISVSASKGLIMTVAIGNVGKYAPGYVNPWSFSAQVISVGAWDHRTQTVWEKSSSGDPNIVESWPDVIAPGVNVIGPWTSTRKKSARQKEADESDERFKKSVPRTDWDKYTMMSGTSQATAIVSGAAAQILHFLNGMIVDKKPKTGQLMFSLTAESSRVTEHDRKVPRLTGNATPQADGSVIYEYYLDEPWKMVKQLLMDTSVPLGDAPPWKVGAGLIDRNYIQQQFGTYGKANPQLAPIKVK